MIRVTVSNRRGPAEVIYCKDRSELMKILQAAKQMGNKILGVKNLSVPQQPAAPEPEKKKKKQPDFEQLNLFDEYS